MNKIVVFNPKELPDGKTIPEYMNETLIQCYNNEKISFLTFVYSDLYDNLKDCNGFIQKYKEFMVKYNLPYAFFPYYTFFNKLMPTSLALPNPRVRFTIEKTNDEINLVCSVAPGFLMLDVKKLKSIEFKFNTEFPVIYYFQDMAQKCFENNLWYSNCCFIDRLNSWEDLKVQTNAGITISNDKFEAEKANYDKLGYTYHDIQQVINILKEKLNQ
jgi:hypothetical protein